MLNHRVIKVQPGKDHIKSSVWHVPIVPSRAVAAPPTIKVSVVIGLVMTPRAVIVVRMFPCAWQPSYFKGTTFPSTFYPLRIGLRKLFNRLVEHVNSKFRRDPLFMEFHSIMLIFKLFGYFFGWAF